MRFTEAERAAIGAELRKLRAEGKDRVHVLSFGGRWRVFREGAQRARKVFYSKDEAIAYGRGMAEHLRSELIVHGKDGRRESRERFSEPVKSYGSSGL